MNNNKTKYLLGILLALIWGMVSYRVYAKYFTKNDVPLNTIPVNMQEQSLLKIDSFELFLNYKDPFQYAEIETSVRSNFQAEAVSYRYPSVSIEAPKQAPPPPLPVVFPEILYKGNIKSKSGRVVALVSINGDNSNIAIYENRSGVQIMGIYEDSIQIQYKNAGKTILKIR
jgi:hypothetical protein